MRILIATACVFVIAASAVYLAQEAAEFAARPPRIERIDERIDQMEREEAERKERFNEIIGR